MNLPSRSEIAGAIRLACHHNGHTTHRSSIGLPDTAGTIRIAGCTTIHPRVEHTSDDCSVILGAAFASPLLGQTAGGSEHRENVPEPRNIRKRIAFVSPSGFRARANRISKCWDRQHASTGPFAPESPQITRRCSISSVISGIASRNSDRGRSSSDDGRLAQSEPACA